MRYRKRSKTGSHARRGLDLDTKDEKYVQKAREHKQMTLEEAQEYQTILDLDPVNVEDVIKNEQ